MPVGKQTAAPRMAVALSAYLRSVSSALLQLGFSWHLNRVSICSRFSGTVPMKNILSWCFLLLDHVS